MTANPTLGHLALPDLLVPLAVERPETNWPGYIAWTVGLLLAVVLLYWLMRRPWHERGRRQSDLPAPPAVPDDGPGTPVLSATGRYHGSTTAGQWLDRIIAHGLGTRSRVELTLTDRGLQVVRPGARDFFVPADRLRGARLDKAIAGKVLTEGGLLVVTWEHGGRLLDSGFRADRSAEHADWVREITARSRPHRPASEGDPAADGPDSAVGTVLSSHGPHDQEGAR